MVEKTRLKRKRKIRKNLRRQKGGGLMVDNVYNFNSLMHKNWELFLRINSVKQDAGPSPRPADKDYDYKFNDYKLNVIQCIINELENSGTDYDISLIAEMIDFLKKYTDGDDCCKNIDDLYLKMLQRGMDDKQLHRISPVDFREAQEARKAQEVRRAQEVREAHLKALTSTSPDSPSPAVSPDQSPRTMSPAPALRNITNDNEEYFKTLEATPDDKLAATELRKKHKYLKEQEALARTSGYKRKRKKSKKSKRKSKKSKRKHKKKSKKTKRK